MGAAEIAKRIQDAKGARGGSYISEGRGRLIVKSLENQNLYKGESFIANFLVESSQSYPGAKVQANAPGSSFAWIQMFERFPETAFDQVQTMILTLMGEEAAGADFAASFLALTGKSNPARGMYLDYETYQKPTKKSGIVLTLPKWAHVPQDAAGIAARRAAMDKAS